MGQLSQEKYFYRAVNLKGISNLSVHKGTLDFFLSALSTIQLSKR